MGIMWLNLPHVVKAFSPQIKEPPPGIPYRQHPHLSSPLTASQVTIQDPSSFVTGQVGGLFIDAHGCEYRFMLRRIPMTTEAQALLHFF
jgi:hypothetical protein